MIFQLKNCTSDLNFGIDGVSFFSSDRHSYSILGEAYIKAQFSNTMLKIGRQEIDTPYADLNEIDIVASYAASEQLSLDLVYSDMTDNADDSESFTNTRFLEVFKNF